VSDALVDGARLLSGEEEAALAIAATQVRIGSESEALAVIDVGGGSTEIAWRLRSGGPVRGLSLPLGSVRLTEALLPRHPIPAQDLALLRSEVARASQPLALALPRGLPPEAALVAVAGTATTLAALELALEPYDAERVEGFELQARTLAAWTLRLARLGVAERKELAGLEPGRADVIVAGLVVLEHVLSCLCAARFTVSGRGVRHGVALRMLAGEWLI
jgi:exopolyphosphatase/guanosine-5'-triphosphate,3'-diphosphate pyrophosphatase